MSRCSEAIIAIIRVIIHFCTTISCFLPFTFFTLKTQCEKGSSEVDKIDMWSEMLPDILEEISDRLPLRDFVSFRGVCRKWRSAPSGRSEITSFSKEWPWLLFYGFDRKSGVAEDTCYLYDRPHRTHQNCCTIRLPHLRDATIVHSKAGWLLARSRGGHFFLYNPLTLTKIDLPKHIVVEEQVCTITTPTVRNNCTVFIVSRITDSALEISMCRVGDTEWKNHMEEISKDLIGTMLVACACDCTGGRHKPEACGMTRMANEKSIYIRASERGLLYDFMNKRCVNGWTYKTRIDRASRKLMFWKEDLASPVHQKNWLERFGENGISICTCGISTRRSDGFMGNSGVVMDLSPVSTDGFMGHHYRVATAIESTSTVEHKLVRASWIEPRFG